MDEAVGLTEGVLNVRWNTPYAVDLVSQAREV